MEITWVGLGFETPSSQELSSEERSRHGAITFWLMPRLLSRKSNGVQRFEAPPQSGYKLFVSGLGTVVDIYQGKKRMGFGIQVETIEEGIRLIPYVRAWLRTIGCRCEPHVWQVTSGECEPPTKLFPLQA